MSGAGEREGLAALDLLVEWAWLAPPAPLPPRPAVALRLLDFPTLLVLPPDRGLEAPGRRIPFGRGKACVLPQLPGPAPLHALLLALPAQGPGPARLLGTARILLGPGTGGARGCFALRGLRGERMGELALAYQLRSLGQEPAALSPALGSPHGAASVPYVSLRGKEGAVELDEEAGDCCPWPQGEEGAVDLDEEAGDCCPRPQGEKEAGELDEEAGDFCLPPQGEEGAAELDEEAGVFCPPPLYYNADPWHTASVRPLPAPKERGEELRSPMASRAVPDATSLGNPLVPDITLQLPSAACQLREALRQLPLVNALLAELSLLGGELGPGTIHPQLAWLYREAGANREPMQPSLESKSPAGKVKKNSPQPSANIRSSSPRFRRSWQRSSQLGAPSSWRQNCKEAALARQAASERNSRRKENTPPPRKLFYGLTNTLRLRLQQTNPDMLVIHERREEYRKKQAEALREKRGKGPGAKGKMFRNSAEQHLSSQHPERAVVSKRNRLDENIRTLMQNNLEKNYETTGKGHLFDLQEHDLASSWKNSDGNAREGGSSEENTDSSVKRTTLQSGYKEKDVQIHLPRAFMHHTDARENKVDEETTHISIGLAVEEDSVAFVLGDDHKPNPNRSFESISEFKYSEDFVTSLENTIYSEDFTNADYTARGSEAFGSSPDPVLLSPMQTHSEVDSESEKSRISGESLRMESRPAHVPVPSTASPVHSFKIPYHLKNRKKSRVAVGSLSSNLSSPAESLHEQQPSLQFKEEGNKSDQTLRESLAVKDKQGHSDKACNVGKGQTSSEKSQSLKTSQVSSYLPSNVYDFELSALENSTSDEEENDNLGTLSITNQCKHISELVVNKLPGYTM
ncbi:PREDICTED: microtubule-associated protein 10 [Crocodylus porosus]|uniref:microtubule-associated protein 10 n=1 Tax=Crocodylus porosus TaxID=8502 RepID=UPI0009399B24|nr:PREDICTED: microtubule-associated protein 10 [Crocodylus porosus]